MARSPFRLADSRTAQHRTADGHVSDDLVSDDRAASDHGGIVLGWLTRIVLFFSLAGLCLFDAISIGTTAMTVADQGSFAALQASEDWQTSKSVQSAYNAAVAAAAKENPADVIATDDFKIDDDGTVHLTVTRTATTLVIYRIGPIRDWANIERHATGKAVD
jgi:hypothetical protein